MTGSVPLRVLDSLVESSPGTYSADIGRDTITVRAGGPTTVLDGPFLNLQFFDTRMKRLLKITVVSITSDAGTRLDKVPIGLCRSMIGPVDAGQEIQTGIGGYFPNAQYVVSEFGRSLEWVIQSGEYFLLFGISPFNQAYPPEKRVATVVYEVAIVAAR